MDTCAGLGIQAYSRIFMWLQSCQTEGCKLANSLQTYQTMQTQSHKFDDFVTIMTNTFPRRVSQKYHICKMSKRPLYEFVKVSFPKKASKKSHVGKISKGPLQFLISAKHKLHKPFTKNTCVTFLTSYCKKWCDFLTCLF